MNILICLTAISSVASFVEWYKKGLRGEEDAATGRCKTRAGVVEVSIVAAVLSAVMGLSLSAFFGLSGLWVVLGISVSIFSLQYVVDVAVVKRAVNSAIERKGAVNA